MATRLLEHDIHIHEATVLPPNGAALAAFAGAGVGSFLVGLIVLLNELGLENSVVLVALVLTMFQLPFSTFLMRISFEAVPKDLEDARVTRRWKCPPVPRDRRC